ncbi:MAG: Ppx/GppA family phosphatase [bacterium]
MSTFQYGEIDFAGIDMKKLAAIDIGTNTALLLVAEISADGTISPLYEQEEIVRLGEDVDKNKNLKPVAMERVKRALIQYRKIIDDIQVDELMISGTSAVRDAGNREELLSQIQAVAGVEMQVLSGKQEAALTFFGALSNKPELQDRIFLVDIGGGSTEFILGDQTNIFFAESLDIGSVRLTEKTIHSDPVCDTDLHAMRQVIKQGILSISEHLKTQCEHFVGVAGTMTTLAAMQQKMESYRPELVDNTVLTLAQITDMIERLQSTTLAARQKIPGLRKERADVILAGSIIVQEVMEHCHFQEVVVSDRGLRYGLLLKLMKDRRVL